MKLGIGKLPAGLLIKYVLPRGKILGDVVVAPSLGVDFGVLRVSSQYLVISSDPVTGAPQNVGWHAVHVSANDVATSGSAPQYLENVILLPENATVSLMRRVVHQIRDACNELGTVIIGGHTELTPGLVQPTVIVTAFTFTNRYVTAAGGKTGDVLLMTKTAGIEGTAIIASEFKTHLKGLSRRVLQRAGQYIDHISIVKEAVAAFNTGYVHAMHDPTEGGIVGGLSELSLASKIGFVVEEQKIPIAYETLQLCRILQIDPLKLIGSGSLLLAVEPAGIADVVRVLRGLNIRVSEIGILAGTERILVRKDGRREIVGETEDEIWRLSYKYGHS